MTEYDVQVRKFHKELSAGTVSLALLAVLAAAGEPMYGYQIAKRLERTGQGLSGGSAPPPGSALGGSVLVGKQSALYPVLRNLSAAGLLDSHVEPSDAGPPRRYYHINATGQGVLREWAVAWRATRDSVDSVLEGLTP